MKTEFSPVYLDNVPISLMGDEARPPLSRIVIASGKRPADVEVRWLKSPSDATGQAVDRDEIIDRTAEPTKPIYLLSVTKPGPLRASSTRGAPIVAPASDPVVPDSASNQVPASAGDRVVAQLGAAPNPDSAQANVVEQSTAVRRASRPLMPTDAVATAPLGPTLSLAVKRAEEQATAEAEAEQRQEEQRESEDILQDEQEALDEADRDDD